MSLEEELFKIPKIQFPEDLSKISFLFKENGFVKIDGVFSKQEHVSDNYFLESVDKISFFYEEGAIDENTGKLVVEKEKALNKVGHALHWINPIFRHFTFNEKIKKIINNLSLLKSPKIAQSMYIFKQPKIGGYVNEHVDSTFLHTKNPENLIGIWIALDNSKIENGCLYFAPKSHKDFSEQTKNYKFVRNQQNIAKNEGPFLEFKGEKPQINNLKYIPIECESGSLILIHGNVLHKSEKNTSNYQRNVYAFHLIDLEENEEWENTNWLQENNKYKFPELFKN
ncbi:unnamed protein product [Meloidogyne enterolobii]|uniref:Uncharacterized protein n=1 Tax=Meloidogyne enterolobii TaxID=390850 RepID=A0ACB0YRK4_MELEN